MSFLKFGSGCPACGKPVWKLTQLHGTRFCPHCSVQLLSKAQSDKDINTFLLIKIPLYVTILSFYFFYFFYVDSILNLHGFNIFMIVSLCMFIMHGMLHICFDKGNFDVGVDTQEDVKNDNFDTANDLTCPNCRSVRLVCFDTYKHVLSEKHSGVELPHTQTDVSHFKGCLHCKSQYRYVVNNKWYIHMPIYSSLITVGYAVLFPKLSNFLNDHLVGHNNLPFTISLIMVFFILLVLHLGLLSFHFFTKNWAPALKPFDA